VHVHVQVKLEEVRTELLKCGVEAMVESHEGSWLCQQVDSSGDLAHVTALFG
jgi:hypothetical protein